MMVLFDASTRAVIGTIHSPLPPGIEEVYAALLADGTISGYFTTPEASIDPLTTYVEGSPGAYTLSTKTVQALTISSTSVSVGGELTISGIAPGSSVAVDGGAAQAVTSTAMTLALNAAGTYVLIFTAPTYLDTTVSVTAS